MGDLDGDGLAELLVQAQLDSGALNPTDGAVVFTAAGAPLYTVSDTTASGVLGSDLGSAVAGVGDVSGDGVPDFAVGAPRELTPQTLGGAVHVYSGADGSELHVLNNAVAPNGRLGTSVSGFADLDGDGFPDVLAGAPLAFVTGLEQGLARIYSGSSGALLAQFQGNQVFQQFGHAVAGLEDLDGDGVGELIVGAPRAGPDGDWRGLVRILSAATGQILFQLKGEEPGVRLGYAVDAAGDWDADGTGDFAFGVLNAHDSGYASGRVEVRSGAGGEELMRLAGDSQGDHFGFDLAPLGDLDGDGTADLAVGSRLDEDGAHNTGAVWVYSPVPRSLASDGGLLSVAAGGTQTLSLVGGTAQAGASYLLLGSASGTAPGAAAGGLAVPLNADAWFAFSLAHPNAPPFADSFGTLDAHGHASPAIVLAPGGPASLAGVSLHHAAVVLGAGPVVTAATNPVALVLGP